MLRSLLTGLRESALYANLTSYSGRQRQAMQPQAGNQFTTTPQNARSLQAAGLRRPPLPPNGISQLADRFREQWLPPVETQRFDPDGLMRQYTAHLQIVGLARNQEDERSAVADVPVAGDGPRLFQHGRQRPVEIGV